MNMKTVIFSSALALMLASPVAADQPPAGQSSAGREAQVAVSTVATSATAHPARAVLRYDLSTAGACRVWSEQPPELCVLFALHVIQLSEHPPKVL